MKAEVLDGIKYTNTFGLLNIRMQTRVCPMEHNEDGERTKGHDLGGAAEDTRFVQLGEEGTEG